MGKWYRIEPRNALNVVIMYVCRWSNKKKRRKKKLSKMFSLDRRTVKKAF